MMLQDDNDNYDFAKNCIRWLTANSNKEVLFVNEQMIEKSFDVPMRDPPLPPVESIVQAVDQGLQGLEEENRFNEILSDVLDRLNVASAGGASTLDTFVRFAAYAATFGLVVFGLGLIAQSRHRPDTEGPALTACMEQVNPRLEPAEQRQRWLLRHGNYWETARALARQELETWFGPEVSTKQPMNLKLPRGLYSSYSARRKLRWLWRLAYDDRPRNVTGKQLVHMGAVIDELRSNLKFPSRS
jgi:hypothetical protein